MFLLQALKLIASWNIRVEEALLSKDTSVTMKQISHPVQSRKVKRRKVESVIMHYKKSLTSQIGYSIRIWTLNRIYFNRNRWNCSCKDFPLKFVHKKVLPWQFDNIKRKFLFMHQLIFNVNKMILAHRPLNCFSM